MSIRRRLGAVAVMVSGLVVMTAGPAAACSCAIVRSEAERMTRADAVFIGELVGSQVDPSATSPRETRRIPFPAPVVLTFKVSHVYKGAVDERQEIVTPGGGGASCGGLGIGLRGTGPFLIYAYDSAGDMYRLGPGQYASNFCSGSRALADGGKPALERPGGPDTWPAKTQLTVGIGVLAVGVAAGLGLAALRTRRRPSGD